MTAWRAHPTRWTLAAVLALTVVLRAPYLGTPLGVDEGGLAFIADNWGAHGGSLYGAYWLDRPPLLLLLFKVAALAGAAGVRALGALAGIALVVAVALLARLVAGERAARIAAVLAAVLGGSLAIHAVYTPAELLAVVPSTLSVLCLVTTVRRAQARWLVAAGALAAAALLIKQSFLDAGVAGAVFLVAAAVWRRDVGFRPIWVLAWPAGAALPLLGLELWEASAHLGDGRLSYALLGFRVDALKTLAGSGISLVERLGHLTVPALGSGLAVIAALALVGLWRRRSEPVIALTLTAWLAAGSAGVLGGGSFWSHYLIQLVPACSVAGALALAQVRPRIRALTLTATVALACVTAIGGVVYLRDHGAPHLSEVSIGRFIRGNARAGDTQYVLYARANVLYYAGLPSPYPYAWSLMVRARPGARQQLYRLLASGRRPTWLVQWQDADTWRIDRGDVIDRDLQREYRRVAVVCGRPIYLRRDGVGRRIGRLSATERCDAGPATGPSA